MARVDARTIPNAAQLETDVCIIGAGPAGITIALELIGRPTRVCVLESGDVRPLKEAQVLSETLNLQDPGLVFENVQARGFGGTSVRWTTHLADKIPGVRYGPLEEHDFEQREWIPNSGWPFGRADLDPYYQRAHEICRAGAFDYSVGSWADGQNPPLPISDPRITTSLVRFGPRDVWIHTYRRALEEAPNITLHLRATVLEIEKHPHDATISSVRVTGGEGREYRVSARLFVLATGGVENARLLLLSNSVEAAGLGNHFDVVGRYFMDHPLVRCGVFAPDDRRVFNTTGLYDLRARSGSFGMGLLTLSPRVRHDEGLLAAGTFLFPRGARYWSNAIESLKVLRSGLRTRRLPDRAMMHARTVLSGLDDIAVGVYQRSLRFGMLPRLGPYASTFARGGWSAHSNKDRKLALFELIMQTEQAPQRDNRIVLSHKLDALGQRQPELRWKWGTREIDSVVRTQSILADGLRKSGLGRLHLDRVTDERSPGVSFGSVAHYMGATRMHVDPTQGVVDQNSQVHGISNLFIAGCSVFPTGGYINPTLTIVALAARLAKRLADLLEVPQASAQASRTDEAPQ